MTELVPTRGTIVSAATRADSDEQLLVSWLRSLNSPNSRRNFEQTARRFLAELPMGLRGATVEDVRDAMQQVTTGVSNATARQYLLRAKSLLTYAKDLGYTAFNAGATIKVRSEGNRGATLAKRIISEADVVLLMRAAASLRDRVMIEVAYAGGLRVSELVGLNWDDVVARADGLIQLAILGKGGKVRNVVLPEPVGEALAAIRGDAAGATPVFATGLGERISTRSVHAMVKRTARRAGLTDRLSPHWLRHAHGSHSLDRGASLAEVQETLGHANVSTTSGYLHARPNSSSGLRLDPGVFKR